MERQNIIELIGKNSGKYNSCIITTYSFDFPFFENRLLRRLRLAQIKNINIFVDAKSLDDNLETYQGAEYQTSNSYSIIPIREVGVFHPKIMLLTGQKEGLLIIGSGNITSSGISTNDEIWSAFHINDLEISHASIFKDVWNYLQTYIQEAKGFNKEKLNRIIQLCPWLNNLPSIENNLNQIYKNTEIQFWTNNAENSIYNLLLKELKNKKISSALLVSPFYDKKGVFLTNLIQDLEIEAINCVTDKEIGNLPLIKDKNISNKIQFYNWKRNDEIKFDHLHAKFFHFITKDNIEYLILGSANATIQAFGSKSTKAVNGEAVLVLKRQLTKRTFINELDIDLKKLTKLKLPETDTSSNNNLIRDSIKYALTICYSELDGTKLKVHLNENKLIKAEIVVIDSTYNIIQTTSVIINNLEIEVQLLNRQQVYKVYLTDGEKRISNYSHIHIVATLLNTISDSSTDKIYNLIELIGIEPENEKMVGLLNHLNYSWIYDDVSNNNRFHQNRTLIPTKLQSKQIVTFTPEEFNKLSNETDIQSNLLNSSNVLIAKCLSRIASNIKIANLNIEESEEEKLTLLENDKDEATGSGNDVKFKAVYKNESIQIKRAIDSVLKNSIDKLNSTGIEEDIKNEYFTLERLTNFSICVELLFIFYKKPYYLSKTKFLINNDRLVTKKIAEISSIYRIQPLKQVSNNFNLYFVIDSTLYNTVIKEFNSISEFVVNKKFEPEEIITKKYYLDQEKICIDGDLFYYLEYLVDRFLYLFDLSKGFQIYDYELLNNKMLELTENIFYKVTYLCLSLENRYYKSDFIQELIQYMLDKFYLNDFSDDAMKIIKTLKAIDKTNNIDSVYFNFNLVEYNNYLNDCS